MPYHIKARIPVITWFICCTSFCGVQAKKCTNNKFQETVVPRILSKCNPVDTMSYQRCGTSFSNYLLVKVSKCLLLHSDRDSFLGWISWVLGTDLKQGIKSWNQWGLLRPPRLNCFICRQSKQWVWDLATNSQLNHCIYSFVNCIIKKFYCQFY